MKDISDAMGNFGNNASLMKANRMTKMILVLVGIFALCNSLQNLNQWLNNDIVETEHVILTNSFQFWKEFITSSHFCWGNGTFG